jgi:hypothetical protein
MCTVGFGGGDSSHDFCDGGGGKGTEGIFGAGSAGLDL